MKARAAAFAVATVGALIAMGITAAPATAQEETPPPEDINCFPLLSSLICYLPIDVGPFNINVPVDINFPAPPGVSA